MAALGMSASSLLVTLNAMRLLRASGARAAAAPARCSTGRCPHEHPVPADSARPGSGRVSVWAFFWAVKRGQFDDLDSPAVQILLDDDRALRRRRRTAMHELTLSTAFLAGLMGSAHCVAMCGGIATALGAGASGARLPGSTLLYQLGRISGYGLIGGLAGTLGAAVGLA